MTSEDPGRTPSGPQEGGSFPSQYDDSGMTSFDKVEIGLRGEELMLCCALPDGTVEVIKCNVGHDVAYAKGQLARKKDIAYSRLQFFLDGKLMFDPLSFNDFPSILKAACSKEQVQVEVKVDGEPS